VQGVSADPQLFVLSATSMDEIKEYFAHKDNLGKIVGSFPRE